MLHLLFQPLNMNACGFACMYISPSVDCVKFLECSKDGEKNCRGVFDLENYIVITCLQNQLCHCMSDGRDSVVNCTSSLVYFLTYLSLFILLKCFVCLFFLHTSHLSPFMSIHTSR